MVMGRIILLLLLPFLSYAAIVQPFTWKDGESFLTFLERKKLPLKLYYNLDKEDQQATEDIPYNAHGQFLLNDKNQILQVLIPVNDELQIHIYRTSSNKYSMRVIPIVSEKYKEVLYAPLTSIPYDDVLKASGSQKLAAKFAKIFKNKVNLKVKPKQGDAVVMTYERIYRLSRPFSMPEVSGAMIILGGKKYSLYRHSDGRFYDAKGAQIEKFIFKSPMRNARITSGFSKSRFHPVLRRYRAHLGVDYGARPGTPIYATGDGTVNFVGYTNGYGKTIKIRHSNGLMSLYAHQKGFKKGIHSGSRVKQGEMIGYVGSTGLSSGPHLHFGMYDGRAPINPLSVMKKKTEGFSGKELQAFNDIKYKLDRVFAKKFKEKPTAKKWVDFQDVYYVDKDTFKAQVF
jgi:murein DD-endopeptidase MepM/ murein hydrolase activator NlpD